MVACSRAPAPSPSSSAAVVGAGTTGASAGDTNGSGVSPTVKPTSEVVLVTKSGARHKVRVEVADSPAERERGLMFKTSMEADVGMLFLFPRESTLSFWMKNTYLPLDMIFIRADQTVAGIVENAEPMTTTSRGVPALSQFVLEVNGGYVAQRGIATGDSVIFEGVPPTPEQ